MMGPDPLSCCALFFERSLKMNPAIISLIGSIIVALIGFLGVVITNSASNKSIENKIITNQAVTDTKLENLTEEVRKHNDFASKIPVLENRVDVLEYTVKEIRNEIKQ